MAESVKQEFGDVVSRDGNGHIIINLSTLPADARFIIEGLGGRPVEFRKPAKEQTIEEDVFAGKLHCHIGAVLPDGWIVGPRSPKTGIVMAIEPVSGALEGLKTWYQGEDHAEELRKQGHANARQPMADYRNDNNELQAIFNAVVRGRRNAHAKLNVDGSVQLVGSAPRGGAGSYGEYWSGTPSSFKKDIAMMEYFSDGTQNWRVKDGATCYVRCVRDEPGITLE